MRVFKISLTLLVTTLLSVHASQLRGDIIDISGLSSNALNSLVAHYDGRRNVNVSGNVVNSWTPVDANGNALNGMTVNSTQRGAGAAELITYDGSSTLSFDDTAIGADGRYLSGSLSNNASTEFTVIWLGHYNDGAPFATSGTYAYNIGPNDISHQRDDFGGGYRVEMYNGTTYGGDDITAFDGNNTAWSTVITANSHAAWANGLNLNLQGSPTNSVAANASIVMGAFSGSGFDMVGDISQMVIFESALSDNDRMLVENYLTSIPEPSAMFGLMCISIAGVLRRRR